MPIIKTPLLFAGSLGVKYIYTLYDSSANLSCIHPDQIKDLENPTQMGRIRQIGTAAIGYYNEVSQAVRLDFYMGDVLLSDEFLTVHRCGYSWAF